MSKTKEEQIEEMKKDFEALPYVELVAAVVQIKSEMIEAYKLLDILQLAVALLIEDQQKGSDGVTGSLPGQYI